MVCFAAIARRRKIEWRMLAGWCVLWVMAIARPSSAQNIGPPTEAEAQAEPLVTIDGHAFTLGDWLEFLKREPALQNFRIPNRQEAEKFVEEAILREFQRKLDDAEAARLDLAHSPEGKLFADFYERRAVGQWFTADRWLKEVAVSEEQVRAAYEAGADEFQPPDSLYFRHIYLATEGLNAEAKAQKRGLAETLHQQVLADPSTFAALAREHSESIESEKGEMAGPVTYGKFAGDLRDALWRVEEGAISEVFESRHGLHLFQVTRRLDETKDFETARPILETRIREAAVRERVDALMAEAEQHGVRFHSAEFLEGAAGLARREGGVEFGRGSGEAVCLSVNDETPAAVEQPGFSFFLRSGEGFTRR